VKEQLAARGIQEAAVLSAFRRIPRHLFVSAKDERLAYSDQPLPIGHGQTISQPFIVALSTQALAIDKLHRVLEIGTGSGYQTAILAELADSVYTIERIDALAEQARQTLDSLGYRNVHYIIADGSLGWAEEAPFDRILAAAAAPDVPQPLLDQLADGGRLVAPIGKADHQQLVVVTRTGNTFKKRKLCDCRFVKLIGREGWQTDGGQQ